MVFRARADDIVLSLEEIQGRGRVFAYRVPPVGVARRSPLNRAVIYGSRREIRRDDCPAISRSCDPTSA